MQSLLDNIQSDCASVVSATLDKEPDLVKTELAIPLLFRARSAEMVAVLVEHGCDVNAPNTGGRTPLHEAAGCLQSDVAKGLLRMGARVDAVDPSGGTALHWAGAAFWFPARFSVHILETVRVLCEAGVPVNASDNFGLTPLHVLSMYGESSVVKLLLEFGADPRKPSLAGWDCLDFAFGHAETNAVLLEAIDAVELLAESGGAWRTRITRRDWPLVDVRRIGQEPIAIFSDAQTTADCVSEMSKAEQAGALFRSVSVADPDVQMVLMKAVGEPLWIDRNGYTYLENLLIEYSNGRDQGMHETFEARHRVLVRAATRFGFEATEKTWRIAREVGIDTWLSEVTKTLL